MQVTKEILDKLHKIDLKEFLISRYNIVFTSSSNSSGSCHCPHPDHDDKHPSFSVWKDKNGDWGWCCHGCHRDTKNIKNKNYGTDIIALIQWLSDYTGSKHIFTFREAVKIACEFIGIKFEKNAASYPKQYYLNKIGAKACHKFLMEYDTVAYDYLLKRGLDTEDLKEWSIGYNGDRITFPLFDSNRIIRGFSSRIIGSDNFKPKYINSANSSFFNKSEYLYGIHRIDRSLDYIIITEGVLDVIGAYKYGLKNVVATLGHAFTEQHAIILRKKYPGIENIIFVYDNDLAGEKGLKKAASIAYNNGFVVNYVSLSDHNDLFDFSKAYKENTVKKIMSSFLPYFYKDFKGDIEEFETVILNFKNKMAMKANKVANKIINPKEHFLLKTFLKNKFDIDVDIGGDTNVEYKKTS